MKYAILEERVKALEREVEALKVASANGVQRDSWRNSIGVFTGDPFMRAVFDEALKYREADRRKAAKPKTRRRRVGA